MNSQLHCEFSVRFAYDVHFTSDAFDVSNPILRGLLGDQKRPAVAVVDQNVAMATPALLDGIAKYLGSAGIEFGVEILPGGEQVKNTSEHVEKIYDLVEKRALCRHSYLLAIGGGSLLDAASFAAGTAHRGIRLIRFPTTTLSQADAGIGVKNAINHCGRKNFVGMFAPPLAVVNDFQFLETLSDGDKRAGYAEAIKVAIVKDADFFDWIEQNATALKNFEPGKMQTLIRRCAEIHLAHIASGNDPFETGSQRPLDFGHWAAHKLEGLSNYRVRHGEAVAIGIALDCIYSASCGHFEQAALDRVLTLLMNVGFTLYTPELDDDRLLQGAEEFREHLGGQLSITLPREIGDCFDLHEIDRTTVRAAIAQIRSRFA